MVEKRNVVLGITGGIAAYKACGIVSKLKKSGVNVDVIMTENATKFITPLTLETLSSNPVATDMFSDKGHWEVEHVSLANKADVLLVAPATANIIGKVACGIADDMLSTTIMATKAKVIFAPAMNVNMYDNPIVQENIKKLMSFGYDFIDSETGMLACGIEAKGRLASLDVIVDYVLKKLGE